MANEGDERSDSGDDLDEDLTDMPIEEIQSKLDSLVQKIKDKRKEISAIQREMVAKSYHIERNEFLVRLHASLPNMVAEVMEVVDLEEEDDYEPPAKKRKGIIVHTSAGTTLFLKSPGLVDPETLKPHDDVALTERKGTIVQILPPDHDHRVRVMELNEKPSVDENELGGLEKEIQELREAVILPLTHKSRYKNIGIVPPKGVLLYGPPGTGKTTLARLCAAETSATFLRLAGPQLVQKYIGEGARVVREAFKLAREKAPTVIFIDEVDAVGTKRESSPRQAGREVQRTMIELLSQMDGFSSLEDVKIIAATNRVDVLDPALLRSGRFDKKIELPLPGEAALEAILRIHSKKMNLSDEVNFQELARASEGFNGAQCKAACTEAGMKALRRGDTTVTHQDFVGAVTEMGRNKRRNINLDFYI